MATEPSSILYKLHDVCYLLLDLFLIRGGSAVRGPVRPGQLVVVQVCKQLVLYFTQIPFIIFTFPWSES
jgi:hypothetical protein